MMSSSFSRQSCRIIRAAGVPAAGLLALASVGASAQEVLLEGAPRPSFVIVPRVSITETLTDNVSLSQVNQQSDLITEISPGIHISSEGGRVKGYFDYAASEILYAKNSSSRRTRNALNTLATLEAVDNWAYIDFSGSISQQDISAFGTQSINNSSINANRTEVSSYRISPYVRGHMGDMADYEARYSQGTINNEGGVGSNATTTEGLVRLYGNSSFSKLGWSADASQQSIDYSAGRRTESDRLNLGLSYLITPHIRVHANGGRESNNYTSFDKQSYGTSGFGVSWSPSERTQFSASRDQRSFGDAHSVSFEHWTARTAWSFTDTKDISVTPNQTGIASLGSVYSILFNQFASFESDPVARAQLVNAFLQANGVNPNAILVSSFLTSAVTLQRRQDLSFTLRGVRDTIIFLATRSESTRLDMVTTAIDDFSSSSLVNQRGFSANYVHRLSPNYSLSVLASQQETSGTSSLQNSTLRLLNMTVTGKVGKKSSASVGVRRVVSSSSSAPYAETAVFASLTVQF